MAENKGSGDGGEADAGEEKGGGEDLPAPNKGDSLDDIDITDVEDELLGDDEEGGDESDESDESDDSDDSDDAEESEDDDESADDEDSEGDDESSDEGGEGDEDDEGDSDDDSEEDTEDESDEDESDEESDDESGDEESEGELEELEEIDHFKIKADEKFGIKPIEIPKKFKDNKSVVELHDAIMENALQAFRNVVGVANRNAHIQEQKVSKVNAETAKGWREEIDELVKTEAIPEYETTDDGKIDRSSEGGKIVEEVFDFMDEWNAKHKDNKNKQIHSFELAHEKWAKQKSEQKKKSDEKKKNKRKSKKGSMVGGGRGSSKSSMDEMDDVPEKGTSLDDIRDGLDL